MGAIKYLVISVLGLVILYMFIGFISFIPYFLGILYSGLFFPVELISQFIYPVGRLPYVVWIAGVSLIFAFICWGVASGKRK